MMAARRAASTSDRSTDAAKPEGRRGRPAQATEMMHVRVPDRLKRDATETLAAIGMSLPDAVRLFMHRIVVERALPLRLDVPNAVSRAALDASLTPRTTRFATPQEMFDALEKAGERQADEPASAV